MDDISPAKSVSFRNIYAADDLQVKPHFMHALLNRLKRSKKSLTHIMRWSTKHDGLRLDFARAHIARRYGLRVGKYSYGFRQFCSKTRVLSEIGAFCSIGENVAVAFAHHQTHTVSSHPFLYQPAYGFAKTETPVEQIDPRNVPASIGHDVWIGRDVTILCGTHIGTGAVVAAGAVVTKDVPPYAIVGGVPAKIIRMRFDEPTIAQLLDSAWWTWSDDVIRKNITHFNRPDDLRNAATN